MSPVTQPTPKQESALEYLSNTVQTAISFSRGFFGAVLDSAPAVDPIIEPSALLKFSAKASLEVAPPPVEILFGVLQDKSGKQMAFEMSYGTAGAFILGGAATILTGGTASPLLLGIAAAAGGYGGGEFGTLHHNQKYANLTELKLSAHVQSLNFGDVYIGITEDGKAHQCYINEYGNLITGDPFNPVITAAELELIKPSSFSTTREFTDGSSLDVTVDESGKAIKELKFNSATLATGSEIDDLADSFNVDENDAPLIKDGAKIISENSNGIQDEQIFNHGDIANMFTADGLSLDDPSVATKKLNPDGSVSYSLAPPSAQLNDASGNSFSLGNVASMVFGRDGAIATFSESIKNTYSKYYDSADGTILFQSALATMATRLANGEDFDDIVVDTVAILLATPGVETYVDKLMTDAEITGTASEYLSKAISTFLITSIVNGGEDMAQAAQNASVQQAINYTLAEGIGGVFQTTGSEGQIVLSGAGVAAAAAAMSLATNVLNGDDIGEEEIGQAGISAGIAFASWKLGGVIAPALSKLLPFTVASGPVGIVVGFAMGKVVQEVLEPKVYDDSTQSHKIVDNGDGSVTLTGLRDAGSLLRTSGDSNDDFIGNDSVDDTAGHDVIVGQAGANEIYALGGHDFIEGRANADYIEAGSGDDFVVESRGDIKMRPMVAFKAAT